MRCIERPTRQLRGHVSRAAFATDSERATLEAKAVTATRPFNVPISSNRLSRTRASEPHSPGTSALVESQTSASTPSSPSFLNVAASVTSPISGSGSSFQSPVCTIMPSGVLIASALGSRIEWVMETKSISKGPSSNGRQAEQCSRARAPARPASCSLSWMQPCGEGVA